MSTRKNSSAKTAAGNNAADVQTTNDSATDATTEIVAEGSSESPPAEAPVSEVTAAVDPFANLPMTKVEDYEFRDFTTAETSDPRKYTEVQKAALADKLPVRKNWKHSGAMITYGRVTKEFKPSSVYGTIDQIVRNAGRSGVPAYVLVTAVREAQIGNKRSHYCGSLPPIGWAEGWVDTYLSKGYGRTMEKAAPLPGSLQAVKAAADAAAKEVAEAIAKAA